MTLFLFLTTDAVQWYLLLVPSLQHFRVHCEPVCCQRSHLQHQPRSFRLTQEPRGPSPGVKPPPRPAFPRAYSPGSGLGVFCSPPELSLSQMSHHVWLPQGHQRSWPLTLQQSSPRGRVGHQGALGNSRDLCVCHSCGDAAGTQPYSAEHRETCFSESQQAWAILG